MLSLVIHDGEKFVGFYLKSNGKTLKGFSQRNNQAQAQKLHMAQYFKMITGYYGEKQKAIRNEHGEQLQSNFYILRSFVFHLIKASTLMEVFKIWSQHQHCHQEGCWNCSFLSRPTLSESQGHVQVQVENFVS